MKNKLKDSASKYSKKIKVKFGFDEELAHLIEAGSDMFLMPSLTEPCGLNAIYSLAYGTVPIVRKTGGLSDIVSEYSTENKKGNGFVFVNFKSAELVAAVKKALTQFKSKSIWQKIVENGMSCDFTWSKSALQYDEIYHNLMKD
jgi:starch synthase